MKLFHILGKESGRNLKKDIWIAVVFIILYIAFFAFLLTPAGTDFLEWAKKHMPFIDLLENTLNDLNALGGRAVGLLFKGHTLSSPINMPKQDYAQFTLAKLFFDLSKASLAAVLIDLLRLLFSKVFLYKGSKTVTEIFQEQLRKTDFLYRLNHILLWGIAFLLGTFAANFFVGLLVNFADAIPSFTAHTLALLTLIFTFLGSCLYFFFSEKLSSKNYVDFLNCFKNQFSALVSEILTVMGTNLIIVLLVNCFLICGFHWVTLIAIFLFGLWIIIAKLIKTLFDLLLTLKIPYVGKKCPFSGILGIIASVAAFLCFYIMLAASTNLQDVQEIFFFTPPLAQVWASGNSVLNELFSSFEHHTTEMVILFITCNIFVILQHVSSSYAVTFSTQVILRFILSGLGMCVIAISYMLLYLLANFLGYDWTYTHFATFIAILGYLIFLMFQPYWAVQGILTTAGVVLMLNLFPVNNFAALFGNHHFGIGICAMIVLVVYIVASLLQNIVAFFEKKKYTAQTLLLQSSAVIAGGAVAASVIGTTAEVASNIIEENALPKGSFCTKCGSPLSINAAFCTKCGKHL